MSRSPASDSLGFLAGGGEMGALIRAHDWSETPLGPPETWPASLVTALRIMLDSGYPMYIAWSPAFIQIYNDAYRPILGRTKHPGALGRSTSETFKEIWDFIGPMFRRVLETGEASTFRDQLLALDRNGYPEECYFTFSYSAIRNSGRIAGVFVTVIETTDKVLRERRQDSLRRLGESIGSSTSGLLEAAVSTLSADHLDLPFLIGIDRKTGLVTASKNVPHGSPLLKADSLAGHRRRRPDAGRSCVREADPVEAGKEPIKQAALAPVFLPGASEPAALLIGGISPRLAFDDGYKGYFSAIAHRVSSAFAEAEAFDAERRRAEQLAKLDRAKTLFFSNISHELRTPLTLMLGPLEDALARATEDRRGFDADDLRMAHRNGQRLLKLVNTLLDFSRIEAGRARARYEPTDLSLLTSDLASQFRSACERAGLSLID